MKKNNKIKSLLLGVAFIAFSSASYAQLESGIYFNMAIPTGGFAEDVSAYPFGQANIGKDAVFGIGGTYRIGYDFDIQVGHIQPFAEASFLWNRVSGDTRDFYDAPAPGIEGKAPGYFNIPIMLGINYKYPLSELLQPYGEFGIGTDLFFVSKEQIGNQNYKYSTTANLCWQIGAGVIVGQYFSAGITYLNMGEHKMKYTSSSNVLPLDYPSKRSLGAIMIRLGFHF